MCPQNWSLVYGSCYQIFSMSTNQSVARAHCLSHGRRLAVLASSEEMTAVQAFFQAELSLEYTWLDGSDAQEEGVWRTSDGEVMTFLGWTVGDPNGGTGETCRVIIDLNVHDITCNYCCGGFLCAM